MLTKLSDPVRRARQKCGTTEFVLTAMPEVITEAADVRFCWPARASGYHLVGRSHDLVKFVLAAMLSVSAFRMNRSPPIDQERRVRRFRRVDPLSLADPKRANLTSLGLPGPSNDARMWARRSAENMIVVKLSGNGSSQLERVGESRGRSPSIDRRTSLVVEQIERDPKPDLQALAVSVGLSTSRLAHLFKRDVGTALGTYLRAARLERARLLLQTSLLRVDEIREAVGGGDKSHFARNFRRAYGLSPDEYRRASHSAAQSVGSLNAEREKSMKASENS
ncbi:MAG: helix-turn-helix domain-containing protein [Blastocatellia bacterium]